MVGAEPDGPFDVPGPVLQGRGPGPYVPNRYLLRVLCTDHWEVAKGELIWLAALSREAGLPVPEPVPTLEGELMTRIATPGVPEGRLVSLMRWVDGRRLTTGFRPRHFRACGHTPASANRARSGRQRRRRCLREVSKWAIQGSNL